MPITTVGNDTSAGTSVLGGNTNSGAIGTVLPTVGGLYVGTVNGGIWKSTNSGASWTPLLDKYAAWSVSALSLDTKDPTQSTLIAGFGAISNGGVSGPLIGLMRSTTGGLNWAPLAGNSSLAKSSVADVVEQGNVIVAATSTGLWVSGDMGASFVQPTGLVANSAGTLSSATLNRSFTSLVADPTTPGRFYAAQAPGYTAQAPGDTSIPAANDTNNAAVYISNNFGKTWARLFDFNIPGAINSNSATFTKLIRLAAGPNHALAVGIANTSGNDAAAAAVYLSTNTTVSGGGFKPLILPTYKGLNGTTLVQLNGGSQATTDFALAIDPRNSSTVYVSGDTLANLLDPGMQDPTGTPGTNTIGAVGYTAPVFRLGLDSNGDPLAPQSLTNALGTTNGSAPHADARAFAFLPDGQMLFASDGGLYLQSSPTTTTGTWAGRNGSGLQIAEIYQAAYDPVSHLVIFASQDNGFAIQSAPGSPAYTGAQGGDGFNVAVNSRAVVDPSNAVNNASALYLGNNNIRITRYVVNSLGAFRSYPAADADGIPITTSAVTVNLVVPDGSGKYNGIGVLEATSDQMPALSGLFVLNRNDPRKLAVGSNRVYIGVDDPNGPVTLGTATTLPSVTVKLTDLSGTNYTYSVQAKDYPTGVAGLAYGTNDDVNALLAAVPNKGLFLSTTLAPTLRQLTSLTSLVDQNNAPAVVNLTGLRAVVFNPAKASEFVLTDQQSTFGSINGGVSFQQIGAPVNTNATYGIEYISNNGVSAVFLGANSNVDPVTGYPLKSSPLFVVSASKLYSATDGSQWLPFGNGLPNVVPWNLSYDATGDVLTVATFGRGIYQVFDLTSNFSAAKVLQFGLAGNDSTPAFAQFSDGKDDNGNTFTRGLVKQGSGTLFINVPATYAGATALSAGVLKTGDVNVLPTATALTLADGSTFDLNNFDQTIGSLAGAGTVTLGQATLSTGGNNTNTEFSGVISGAGGLTKEGTATLTLSGANAYSGITNVRLGFLAADASGAFSPNSAFTVGGQATLALNNTSQTIGSLAGAGTVQIGTGTLAVGYDNTNSQFNGDIQGSGTLAKIGTGMFILGGTNIFTGLTSVTAGTLMLTRSASLAGGAQILPGAELQHGGSIGGLVVNAGTLTARGGSIGGNLTLQPIGTMKLLADGTGLTVTGTTTLAGTLVVRPNPLWSGRVALNSGGPAAGHFTQVFNLNHNLRIGISYGTNETDIVMNAPGFADLSVGSNGRAAGAVLDADYATATGAYANIMGALLAEGLSDVGASLPQFTGAGYTALQSSALQSARLFQTTVADRITGQAVDAPTTARDIALAAATRVAGAGGLTDTGLSLVSFGNVAAAMPRPDETRIWLQGIGQIQSLSGNTDTPGLKATLGGVVLGVERSLSGKSLLGMAVGFDHARVTTPDLYGSTQQSDWHAALYGRAEIGHVFLGGSVEYSRADANPRRQVAISNIAGTISGRSLVDVLGAQIQAGTNLQLAHIMVQPVAGLQLLQLAPHSFSETGSTGAELAVAGQNQTALRSVIGANLAQRVILADGVSVTPSVSLGWGHEFLNPTARINATFLGGATGFVVSGTAPGRDEALLGAAVAWQSSQDFQFYVGYNASIARRQTLQSATVGLRLVW